MSQPVYQSDRVTLYRGDCRVVVDEIERGSLHLIATDPPYGVNFVGNGKHPAILGDDGSIDVPLTLGAWARKLRNNRHVYVFGYSEDSLRGPLGLSKTAALIWDKGKSPGLGNTDLQWAKNYEPITFGVFDVSPKNRESSAGSLTAKMRRGSILRVNRKAGLGSRRHPTEKPVELMIQLIESSSVLGDLVADPFAGTGSTLVAAVLCGRKAVGVELDDRNVPIAIERIQQAERLADQMESL